MGLQVWLPLNGNLNNQGLNGNLNISAINTLTFVNGKIGQCYQRATNDTQVTTGINIDSNLLDILGTQASVAVWVKPLGTHTHYNGTLLSSGNWNAKRWAFGVSQDNTKVDVLCGGYNTYIDCSIPVNEWTHLCSTFDNGTSKLYKNGIYIGELTGRANFDSDATNTCIGRETYASGYFGFNGLINDVRIYDHCLSDKEVEEISKGLVLHYKLDDPYAENSNIINSIINDTAYNSSIGKYGYNETSNLGKINGNFHGKDCVKIYTLAEGQTAQPYAYFSNLFTSNGTNAPAYKALSFDYFTTVPTTTWLNIYKLGSGSGTAVWKTINSNGTFTGTYTNSSNSITVKPNEWNHIEIVFHGTTDANAEWGYCINGPAHTTNSQYYFLYANIQVEENDHVTGYGNNFHNNIIYDSSGYSNNGTITGTLINSSLNTPRYNYSTIFNGTERITANSLPAETKTLTCWAKTTKNKSTSQQIIADSNSALTISFYNGTIIGVFGTTRNTGSKCTLGTEYKENDWNFFAVVKTSEDGQRDIYCNGVKLTPTSNDYWSAATGFFVGARNTSQGNPFYGEINDIRAYVTALTEDQILELYHISATIDNKGNSYARELVEK